MFGGGNSWQFPQASLVSHLQTYESTSENNKTTGCASAACLCFIRVETRYASLCDYNIIAASSLNIRCSAVVRGRGNLAVLQILVFLKGN